MQITGLPRLMSVRMSSRKASVAAGQPVLGPALASLSHITSTCAGLTPAAELPHFLKQIRRTFTAQQIHNYLDDLERAKFMSPIEDDEDMDLEDEDPEFADYPLDNPILGAQELLRFARVKEMLQAG